MSIMCRIVSIVTALCLLTSAFAQLPTLPVQPPSSPFTVQQAASSSADPAQFDSSTAPANIVPPTPATILQPPAFFSTQSAGQSQTQTPLAAPFVSAAPQLPGGFGSLAPQFIAPIFTAPNPIRAAGNLTRYIVVLTRNATDEANSGNFTDVIAQVLPPGVVAQQVIAPPRMFGPGTQSTMPNSTITPPTPGSLPSLPSRSFTSIVVYMTPDQVEQVRQSKYVSYVEEDGQVSLRSVTNAASGTMNTHDIGLTVPTANVFNNAYSQANPFYSWGLDRIDQRSLPLDGSFFPTNDGSSVTIYLIDTGCRTSHQEFGGRAKLVYTIFNNGKEDQHGHGTHTAAKAGGSNVGVARKAKIACLSVLDANGSGTYSDFLQAMQFVMDSASGPSVLSLSIGGTYSQSVNDMAQQLIAQGVPTISAAGNSGSGNTCSTNAYGVSPASAPGMIVASSMNATDYFSSFSNYGSCVTVAAPGDSILSAWGGGDSQYAIASGTSMATPHLTGVAALYMHANPTSTPAQLRNSMMCSSTNNVMYGVPSTTPNSLLYMKLDACNSGSNPTANWTVPNNYGGYPQASQNSNSGSDYIPTPSQPQQPSRPSSGPPRGGFPQGPGRNGPGPDGPNGPPPGPNRTFGNGTTQIIDDPTSNDATALSSSVIPFISLLLVALVW